MTRSGKVGRGVVIALSALFLAAAGATAQQRGVGPGRGPGMQDRMELERRVRARFAEMMQQRLGLSDEQAQRVSQTVESFMERRQRLMAGEQALRRRMEAVVLEEAPTEAEARAILERMRALREEEVELFEAEQAALTEVLTPVQLVQFHAMREQLAQRIVQLRGGMGPGRPPGGMGGMGGAPGGMRRPPGGFPPDTLPGAPWDGFPWGGMDR